MMILFRVDGYKQIGYGHLMRCITLATQFIKEKQEVLFVSYKDDFVKNKLEYSNIPYQLIHHKAGTKTDLNQLVKILKQYPQNICIYDSYNIQSDYEKKLLPYTKFLVGFDDEAKRKFEADLIINQNYGSENYKYKLKNKKTIVLSGIQFALLREEILKNQKKRINKFVKNILIIMGGSDPFNQIIRIVNILNSPFFSHSKLHIVTNSNHKHFQNIKKMAAMNKQIVIHTNVTHMGSLIKKMDLAVSAGGSTTWELLYIGVPTSLLIVAQNQVKLVRELAKSEYIENLGWYNNVSDKIIAQKVQTLYKNTEKRQLLFKKGKKLLSHSALTSIAKIIIQKSEKKYV